MFWKGGFIIKKKRNNIWLLTLLLAVGSVFTGCANEKPDSSTEYSSEESEQAVETSTEVPSQEETTTQEQSTEETVEPTQERTEEVTEPETEESTEEPTEEPSLPASPQELTEDHYYDFIMAFGRSLTETVMEQGGYVRSCTVYLEKIAETEDETNPWGMGQFALESVTDEGVYYCVGEYTYDPALAATEDPFCGFVLQNTPEVFAPFGEEAVAKDVWEADTALQTVKDNAYMTKTYNVNIYAEPIRLQEEVVWNGETLTLQAILYTNVEYGNGEYVLEPEHSKTENYLDVRFVSYNADAKQGTVYLDYVQVNPPYESAKLIYNLKTKTLAKQVETIENAQEFSNPVEIMTPSGMVTVPDWYVGKLLNPEELKANLPSWNDSSRKEHIQFLIDADMNDETGYVKKAEEQLTPEASDTKLEVEETTQINGENLCVQLYQKDVWNHVYVPETGDVIVIDGVTYDCQTDYLLAGPYEGGELIWREHFTTYVYVTDIDKSDAFTEILVMTSSSEICKKVIFRYDGTGLYQVAALGQEHSIGEISGDGTIKSIYRRCYNGAVEFFVVERVLTLEDGVLYHRPVETEYEVIDPRSAEERAYTEYDCDLRTVNEIILYTEPRTDVETVNLTPQQIDWIKVIPDEVGFGGWVCVRGLADGSEGWMRTEDMQLEDFLGEWFMP